MRRVTSFLAAAFIAASAVSANAASYVYGNPVDSNNANAPVGDVWLYNGVVPVVKYYNLLEGSAPCTYGVSGCGMSPDSTDGDGMGPVMKMEMLFDLPTMPVDATLIVWNKDLDLKGVNDPDEFNELFKVDGVTDWIDDYNDPEVVQSQTNSYTQLLKIDLGVLSGGPVLYDFLFKSNLDNPKGYHYRNTKEKLWAKIVYQPTIIPLPATLPMLAAGLGLIAVARRRHSS